MAMIDTCANPGCGSRFLYLKSGKLFHFPQHDSRKVHTYWLCDKCMIDVHLEWRIGEGVKAVLSAAPATPIFRNEDGTSQSVNK